MKLTIRYGESSGTCFALKEGVNFVGRADSQEDWAPEIDLEKFDDEAKVSRKHAKLVLSGGSLTVEDLESMNGTFAGKERRLVPGEVLEVKLGEELIFGATVLKLEES